MSVSNEELVKLYQSTEDKKNREILFKKIYEKNYGLIYTICGNFLEKNKHRNLEVSDLYQEARYIMLEAIRTFDPTRGTKFSSYFANISYKYLSGLIRDKYAKFDSEISVGMIHDMQQGDDVDFNDVVDNKYFSDNIRLCIKKIEFRDTKSKFIFECRHGLNEFNRSMTCQEIANIVGLTQQRVDVICKSYESKLKEIVNREIDKGRFKREDFGLDAQKK